jgi:hypothetical protein
MRQRQATLSTKQQNSSSSSNSNNTKSKRHSSSRGGPSKDVGGHLSMAIMQVATQMGRVMSDAAQELVLF